MFLTTHPVTIKLVKKIIYISIFHTEHEEIEENVH
jgi:hypothetical protein